MRGGLEQLSDLKGRGSRLRCAQAGMGRAPGCDVLRFVWGVFLALSFCQMQVHAQPTCTCCGKLDCRVDWTGVATCQAGVDEVTCFNSIGTCEVDCSTCHCPVAPPAVLGACCNPNCVCSIILNTACYISRNYVAFIAGAKNVQDCSSCPPCGISPAAKSPSGATSLGCGGLGYVPSGFICSNGTLVVPLNASLVGNSFVLDSSVYVSQKLSVDVLSLTINGDLNISDTGSLNIIAYDYNSSSLIFVSGSVNLDGHLTIDASALPEGSYNYVVASGNCTNGEFKSIEVVSSTKKVIHIAPIYQRSQVVVEFEITAAFGAAGLSGLSLIYFSALLYV